METACPKKSKRKRTGIGLLMLGMFLIFPGIVNAQSTIVKIIDINVSSLIPADTISQVDSTRLIVQFKIKNVQQASKAYIYFGTLQDTYDVLNVEANFVYVSGKYYLEFNNVRSEIVNYTAKVVVTMSNQQNSDYACATLFVEDNNGQNTSSLYSFK